MIYISPAPQTITTALSAQLVINRIYRDQIKIQATFPKNPPQRKPGGSILMGMDDMEKHQVSFNLIFIIAPFEITDFISLHKHIIEREPLPPGSLDTLKRIYKGAMENICLFEKIQAITPDEKIFACYEIHPDNSISRKYKRSDDYEGQRFTNNDLFRYCNAVEDLISICLPKDAPAPDQRLSHDKIALINYYNGITITEINGKEIAKKAGWINKTSGHKIWQRYLFFSSNANRNAIPDNPTPTTKRNKISLFESVLPFLNDTGKQKAENEINLLKIKLQTD
ncbi:MAG: hypothetical protein WCJ95_17470 [Mariniphaga sp.]